MKVVFTYIPIRLKDITEIYLNYSIKNLNKQNIVPVIYSDKNYFENSKLKTEWIYFDVDSKYKFNNLFLNPIVFASIAFIASLTFLILNLKN